MDAALPRFSIVESTDRLRHHKSVLLRRPHSEPEPAYSIHHADPAAESSRNCYAAGLVDAYNEQVLFGEVMIEPGWTFPTLSQEAVRLNGGIAPPPEPIMPTEFTIQLYNPDQQVVVTQRSAGIVGGSRWDFSLPVDVFRIPSVSALDRARDDPIANATTPKINFTWRRESKFSKELTCYVTGKSTDVVKKKSREPDIAIAIFRSLRDITIYEPNLSRVELEDPKGLEVVILIGAVVIRDVYFGKDLHAVFNISEPPKREGVGMAPTGGAAVAGLYAQSGSLPAVPGNKPPVVPPRKSIGSPPKFNPRTQWEIDAETKRLEMEERARRKEDELRRRERDRLADEETRRLRRMVEEEERQRRDRAKQVEEETRRLQKVYGTQQPPPANGSAPPLTMSGGLGGTHPSHSAPVSHGPYQPPPQQTQSYQQAPGSTWFLGNQVPQHQHYQMPPAQPPRPQPQSQSQTFNQHSGYQQQYGYPPPGPAAQQPYYNYYQQPPHDPYHDPYDRPRTSVHFAADDNDRMRRKRSSVF